MEAKESVAENATSCLFDTFKSYSIFLFVSIKVDRFKAESDQREKNIYIY